MKIPRSLHWVVDQPSKDHTKEKIIEERPANSKLWNYEVLGLLVLAGITFFFGADRLALFGPDEPRYAEIAREMFVSGDYISPRLCGCLWFEKPVLYYWLGALAFRLFGVNEFAARFPSGLAALVAMLVLYWAIRHSNSTRWASLSSLVFATSGILIIFSHAATPDMILTASMTMAILAAYLATQATGRAERLFIVLCSASMGLSFLAKGLVGVVLILAILLLFLLITGRLRFLAGRHLFIGAVVFLLVAAFWYLPVTLRHGSVFIDEFFVKHHFQRYVSNVYGHPQPIYFFPAIAVMGVLPWSFFLIPAIARLRQLTPRDSERDSLLVLGWVWLLVPLIFFSLSESKLPGYLLPVFPALALLIGAEIERFHTGESSRRVGVTRRATMWLSAALLLMIGGLFIWYLQKQGVPFTGWQAVVQVLPLAFAIPGSFLLIRNQRRVPVLCAAAFVASLVVVGSLLLFPNLNERIGLKRLSLEAAAALRPDEKIGYYILKEYAAVFYAEGRVACGLGEGDVLNALREDKLVEPLEIYPSLIFITRERWLEGLMKDERFEKEFIARQGDFYAFRVRLKVKR